MTLVIVGCSIVAGLCSALAFHLGRVSERRRQQWRMDRAFEVGFAQGSFTALEGAIKARMDALEVRQ